MRIAMFTNTYLPHVGGVARSVKSLEDQCRKSGNEVLIIAPEYHEALAGNFEGVLRVPAICNFNGSDFSVRLPVPNIIHSALEVFAPDVIHSHHPFLLGDAALREAWKHRVPIVFTHHTLYERYTHYVPLDSAPLKRMAIQLSTEYCNLCDLVIAPSESIRRLLRERGVDKPIEVSPTGVDVAAFASGDAAAFRAAHQIPADARVVGHVGRLAREKNLIYLTEAVIGVLAVDPSAVFLLVGRGDALGSIVDMLSAAGMRERVFAVGMMSGKDLIDAYAAMDVFVFASQSETQGMVLAEAMAAGRPVIAIDGPGVREIVRCGLNGILLAGDATAATFTKALDELLHDWILAETYGKGAQVTSVDYDQARTAGDVVVLYERALRAFEHRDADRSAWDRVLTALQIEWDLISAKVAAAAAAMIETDATEARLD